MVNSHNIVYALPLINVYILNKRVKLMKLMKGASPFYYKRGRKSVLLLHGFSSTPQELKELGKYLANEGITVYAPLLPGHGTKPEDMLTVSWQDWINCAEEGIKKLEKSSDEIYLIGSSIGANIAFIISQKSKVKGIVSLAMPLKFKFNFLLKLYTRIRARFHNFQKKHYHEKDLHVVKNKVHYKVLPLPKFKDLFFLMGETKKVLPIIKVPVLIMQSTTDGTVTRKNAKNIYDLIKHDSKKLVFIPDSYHVFVMDKNRKIVFVEILEFLNFTF